MDVLGVHIRLSDGLHPLGTPLGVFLINLIAWVLIALAVYQVSLYLIRYGTRRIPTRIDDLVIGIVRGPLLVLLVALGFVRSWERAFGPEGVATLFHRVYRGLLIILGAHVAWRVLYEIIIAYLKPVVQQSDSTADDIVIPVLSRIGPSSSSSP